LSDVAFSRNGRWAAHISGPFGKEPRNVALWDLKEWRSCGSHFRTLARLNPFALALSNDARWCLYADSIGGVHRLGETGEIWEGHAHRELTIAKWLGISADGKRALSACQHGRLVAWDIDANRHEIVWDENDNYTMAMNLDSTGTRAIVARADGSVALLELWPTCVRTLYTIEGEPTALASLDSSLFAVATANGKVEVHRVETSKEIVSFSVDEKPTALALSADAKYVAAGTEKGTIYVWGLAPSRQTSRYRRGHTYEITQIAFSHDDTHVISVDSLHIKEWLIGGGKQEGVTMASPATGQVKVTTDGLHAVAVLENGQLGVWSLRSGELESTLPHPSGPSFGDSNIGPAERIALASQASKVLAWNKKLLCVWNLTSGACVGMQKASEAGTQPWAVEIRDAAITCDGAGVVYLDGMDVSFWRPVEGDSRILGTYDHDPPGHIAISPDGRFALSSGGDRQVHLWRLAGPPNQYVEALRLARQEKLRLLREMKMEIRQLSFDPDASYWPSSYDKPSRMAFVGSRKAIVTTGDGALFLVDIHDEALDPPKLEGYTIAGGHSGGVSQILVHPQCKLLVTSSYGVSVKVWDFERRCCTAVLDAHPGTAQQLSASAERILVNTRDGVLKLVDVCDGSLVAAFQADKQIVSCDSDAELRYIVALDQSGQMHFLRLEPDETQAQ
ncbi:MAG TPA: WD40 repeat domain-containing protein, partial [Alphaproteobacteria bacterium]|nr:WD40 repeat domain-containing protein [Alphaproteobacteria bacterium]